MQSLFDDWFTWFWKILVRPGPATFLEIDAQAGGRSGAAVFWIVVADVVALLARFALLGQVDGWQFVLSLIVLPVIVILWVWSLHLAYQRILKRKKSHYEGLLCAFSGILLVFAVVSAPLAWAPVAADALVVLLLIYQGVLFFIATRAILRLNWRETLMVFGFGVLGLAVALACVPAFLLSLLQTNSQLFGP